MKKKVIIVISIIGIISLLGICYIFRDDLLKFKRNIYPVHSVMKSEEKEEDVHNEEIANITNTEEEPKEKIKEEKTEDIKTSKEETVTEG